MAKKDTLKDHQFVDENPGPDQANQVNDVGPNQNEQALRHDNVQGGYWEHVQGEEPVVDHKRIKAPRGNSPHQR